MADGVGVPLLVRVAGQRVVGVGGGAVAVAKLLPLAEAGADLHVVAPTIDARFAGIAHCERRTYAGPSDLAGALLVVAATDDPAVNARVAADAAASATLCVRSDAGGDATADVPATLHRDPAVIAVATGVPVLSAFVARELGRTWGPELGAAARLLGELRRDPALSERLARLDPAARRSAWRSIPLADILRLIRTGDLNSAREAASACLSSSSD